MFLHEMFNVDLCIYAKYTLRRKHVFGILKIHALSFVHEYKHDERMDAYVVQSA